MNCYSEGNSIYTVFGYLAAKVKFDIPREALLAILADRNIEPTAPYGERDVDNTRLAYADMLKWFVLGASKKNNTSDTDNGWSHSGGGYEIDREDRRLLIAEANAIYSELEPSSLIKNKSSFKISSFGIQRCDYDLAGNPIPHLIK